MICNETITTCYATFPTTKLTVISSERRASVLEELLEVKSVPLASLWAGLECVRVLLAADLVEACRVDVRSAVGLTTGLCPDEGILDGRVDGVGGRSRAEAGSLEVAPCVTLNLDLVARTALVDDEVCREALGTEERRKVLVVGELVLALGRVGADTVIVRDVGGNTADRGVWVELLRHGEEFSEENGSLADVALPSKPASVCRVDVEARVRKARKSGDGQGNRTLVHGGSDGALGHGLLVGDDVTDRVGLDDDCGGNVRNTLKLRVDGLGVSFVTRLASIGNLELAVGRFGRAVPVRKVVDNELDD
jgi:hypothetical protein